MRTFTSFWKQIRSSCDVRSYAHHKHSFWKGVRYLYALSVVLAAVIAVKTAVFVLLFFPHIDDALVVAGRALDEVYPPELRVTIESGALTTNVQTPYVIDIPLSLRSYWGSEELDLPHMIVIDPGGTIDDFPSYRTLVLLTERNLVVIDRDDTPTEGDGVTFEQYRVKPYSSFLTERVVITKEKFDVVVSMLASSAVYVKPLILVLLVLFLIASPFLIGAFSLTVTLLFLLVATLPLWLISLLAKKKYSYSHLYILSLHGMTLSALYGFTQNALGFHVPFASAIIFFGFMLLVIFRKKKA